MDETIKQLNEKLQQIALQVVTLEPGDIPALGELLNAVTQLKACATELNNEALENLTKGLSGYIEKLVMNENDDVGPVEEGVQALQEVCHALSNEGAFSGSITHVLERMGVVEEAESDSDQTAASDTDSDGPAVSAEEAPVVLTEEDIQIMSDFVVESLENLESIEVNLVDLEQDPGNKETIDSIFRPFHTIKGVSGFLNLAKINRLGHSTENLLDSARQGEIHIDDTITDIILESVDVLKRLVGSVEKAIGAGPDKEVILEGGINVDPLIAQIEKTGKAAKEGYKPLGEILLEKGTVSEQEIEKGLEKQKQTDGSKKLGQILVEEKAAESRDVISALRDQKKRKRVQDLHVKVDTNKLDNLIDLTGELVISQSMLRQNDKISKMADQKLDQNLSQLSQIVSSLQRIAMSMRMVPIKATFQKMVRLVRDLARSSGKEVSLEMFGEDTEIDRNVVDELYEPMVHMIRNACDHGLEHPDERVEADKPAKGTVQLRAYHKGGNIVIEIADDGRGLNKDKIIAKAQSSGLIDADANLTDAETYNLIFEPGFSTAAEVTDISGRGVGMDVVKRGIEKLRGRLDVRSTPGQGTTVVISLPLTLAIIEGMVVRLGRERYILPTMAIVESFKPTKEEYFTVEGKGEMVMARGNLIPLVRLDKMFAMSGDAENPWDGLVVVVENKEKQRAILIDELLGQEEIVIKSLGEALKNTKGLAGGAILGDGRVGLILDIAGLYELAAA